MNKRVIFALIFGYFVVMALGTAGYGLFWFVFQRPPEQPIAFSHRKHVEVAGLDCEFCHQYADEAAMPSIPSVSKCMSCHINVKVNSPEIIKLTEYWDKREPVPWNKVHVIPKRKAVGFTHKRHLKAEALQHYIEYVAAVPASATAAAEIGDSTPMIAKHEKLCGVCHGEVRGMDPMRRVRSLKMGWCVDCHTKNEASIDCLTCHR